ncbi:uncharacterized protein LOC109253375 [Panthera pardus]|uniref:Uncharacterized protein LOC109253375 n=1 Tax=Panthera pardus TaxID=9691 RepID=A0A9W2UIF9_PANPR|nr:uncharacterized protein LOC109253375 [Panthera pardus]
MFSLSLRHRHTGEKRCAQGWKVLLKRLVLPTVSPAPLPLLPLARPGGDCLHAEAWAGSPASFLCTSGAAQAAPAALPSPALPEARTSDDPASSPHSGLPAPARCVLFCCVDGPRAIWRPGDGCGDVHAHPYVLCPQLDEVLRVCPARKLLPDPRGPSRPFPGRDPSPGNHNRVPLASLSSRVLHSANRTEPQAGSCEDKNLLCPAPSSPEDPLLFTVQNLQVFAFGITLRFYHRAREGNHSVVTRRGRPLLASQGPSSVLLSPSWFLAGEGEERRTFSALGSSWFSSSLATCPWAGGPPQLSFPIFGAWCRGTTA